MKRFALIALLMACPAWAQIQRCEGADGKITYSNESCPQDTKAVRKVDTRPPVLQSDAKAAKTRAQHEAEELKALEKQREAEEKSQARAREAARKKEEKQEQECNKLRMNVNKAKDAVEHSTLNKRAELEKKLERAQEAFDKECAQRQVAP